MELKDIKRDTQYTRRDDMSPTDQLQLVLQDDGDVCIGIYKEPQVSSIGPVILDIEFCTIGTGGGKSPHTMKALRELVLAVAKDNEENPIS